MSSFSLNKEQQEKLADKIFNSTNFAILSSIGLHAIILGVFFADFSNKSHKAATNPLTDVGLVKLTPLEQSRLLDFSAATTPPPSTPPPLLSLSLSKCSMSPLSLSLSWLPSSLSQSIWPHLASLVATHSTSPSSLQAPWQVLSQIR